MTLSEKLIISPVTMKYQIFKLVIVISSIYSSLLYAVIGAFRLDLDYDTYETYLLESPDAKVNPITTEAIKFYEVAFINLECIFLSAICINFITSYTDPDNGNEVRDIYRIVDRYLKGNFVFDFVTIFPMSYIFRFPFSRLLILIKCLRLINLREFLDVNTVMS